MPYLRSPCHRAGVRRRTIASSLVRGVHVRAGLVVAGKSTHDAVVPTLSDLVARHTALDEADLDWLHSLVSDWQLLADLSFADLVLWAPLLGENGWIAIAQMRPTTGPTVYHDDIVGSVAAKGERQLIDTAWNERRICREGDPDWSTGVPVREETIPVRRAVEGGEARFLAVIQRSTNLSSARTPSRLELTYLQSASDLAQMVAEGRFPFSGEEPILVRSPRVGDGLLRLDRAYRVTYASPNALSAYRRLGLHADLVGAELGRVTAALCYSDEPINEDLMIVASGRAAKETEVESGGTIVQLRAIPLIVGGGRIGALVLIRDVTELQPARARADDEGRHDPRDPPPGQEQPADRRRPAQAAGQTAAGAGGPRGAGGGGTPGGLDRHRARDPVSRARGVRGLRRDRRPRDRHGR